MEVVFFGAGFGKIVWMGTDERNQWMLSRADTITVSIVFTILIAMIVILSASDYPVITAFLALAFTVSFLCLKTFSWEIQEAEQGSEPDS